MIFIADFFAGKIRILISRIVFFLNQNSQTIEFNKMILKFFASVCLIQTASYFIALKGNMLIGFKSTYNLG